MMLANLPNDHILIKCLIDWTRNKQEPKNYGN